MLAREEAWYSCTLIEEKNSKLRLMLKVVPERVAQGFQEQGGSGTGVWYSCTLMGGN